MDTLTFLPAASVSLIAYVTVSVIARARPITLPSHQFEAIDGLRGYLALFVFIHHACVWFLYLRGGPWGKLTSPLYTHLGQSGVALFFMITSLLFFTKILDSKGRPIDWRRLYIGRVLRLVPLYAVVVIVMLLIVLIMTDWSIKDSYYRLLKDSAKWFLFTVPGSPDVNGLKDTFTIVAGAPWTLPYEWLYYLALPILALLAGRKPSLVSLLLTVAVICAMLSFWGPNPIHFWSFGGGVFAAIVVRYPGFRAFCRSALASCMVVFIIVVCCAVFPDAYDRRFLVLLWFPFALIAGGCTIFGLLSTIASRTLGEMTYSLYLLHGMLLYMLFRVVLGAEYASGLSAVAHWSIVACATPLLLFICSWTFRAIEAPAMKLTSAVVKRVSEFEHRLRGQVAG